MTTQEVRQALKNNPGVKYTHPNFSSDEYVYQDADTGEIKTEDGYPVIEEFWEIRNWWTGWYEKEEDYGHTDNVPNDEYLQQLRLNRNSINDHLVEYACLESARTSPKEYGMSLMNKRGYKHHKR